MAYEIPDLEDFRAKFPELDAVGDSEVTAAISMACDFVDTSWGEGDYPKAILYLAAHLSRLQQSAAAGGGSGGVEGGAITGRTISIEGRSITTSYQPSSAATTASVSVGSGAFLTKTNYGIMFDQIRRRNVIPMLVVTGDDAIG